MRPVKLTVTMQTTATEQHSGDLTGTGLASCGPRASPLTQGGVFHARSPAEMGISNQTPKLPADPSLRPARSLPTESSCADPVGASMPAPSYEPHSTSSPKSAPSRGPIAPVRNYEPPARPPGNAIPRPHSG